MILNNKVKVLFLIFLVVLFWAGNFVSVLYIVKEIDVFTALALRLIIVALFLSYYLRTLPSKNDFFTLILATICLVPGHFGLLFLSILNTKSLGGISVLIQLAIPFSIIFACIIFKDRPSNLLITGLIVAFSGIVFLLYDPNLLKSRSAFILAIGSAFCLGLYFIVVKRLKDVKSLAVIAWTSLLGSPIMYLFMIYTNHNFSSVLKIENTNTILAFFYTVILGSILGHGIWAYLVKTEDISFISPFLLLVPLFTVFLSAIFLNEEITSSFIITSSVIMFGIFLVFISKIVKNN